MIRSFVVASSCLLACGFDPAIETELEPADPVSEDSMRIPVDFRAECAELAALDEAPADLTMAGFFACLTDESRDALDRLYRTTAVRSEGTLPATLDELIARYGETRVAEVALRDLVQRGAADVMHEESDEGVAPDLVVRYRFPSAYGLDPTDCGSSCLSTYVTVVGGRRRIGYYAASASASAVTDDKGKRYLDEINPGKIPDFRQADLASDDLQSAGCGPVSAINLFEWWGIAMFNGGTELKTFDARASFIAGRMNTLEGLHFTDDDALFDFITGYPAEMFRAGRIPGHPGSHYMRDNPEGWKVMMSYIARGWPVVALYATSEDSLHWAAITGLKGGKLVIANGGDRTLADFHERWEEWATLAWYADYASGLWVDYSTFVALTGWGARTPPPDRFARRNAKEKLPSYTSSKTSYLFRYCVGSNDEIGRDSETPHVSVWAGEPSGALPGYCMFTGPVSALTLKAVPSNSAVSSASGANVTLAVESTSVLNNFASAHPGAHCIWHAREDGKWVKVNDLPCTDPASRTYTFQNNGQYTKMTFHVHSAELARVGWDITVR